MVDSVKIIIKAGDGGDGAVHFRREKYKPKGGPDGGDGGKGGDVYIETDKNLSTLSGFAHKKRYQAEDGRKGMGALKSGKAGGDLVIKVPVGTVVRFKVDDDLCHPEQSRGIPLAGRLTVERDSSTRRLGRNDKNLDMDKKGMKELVAKGGRGGRGNWRFRSSVNQTPQEAEKGENGEGFELDLELKLLADVGLIGLPNAGKSTLLSILTEARPKVADYEFTTLEPNLGVMSVDKKSLVVADIPGLIEGASKGKGLGDQFLKHVERTSVLVHLVSSKVQPCYKVEPCSEWRGYEVVRRELGDFGGGLEKKKEIVVLNKIDLLDKKQVKKIVKEFAKKGVEVLPISCGTSEGIEDLKRRVWEEF